MKIKKLSIRGYRSLKDVTWEPGDLNVLIGPNASGKSNFLRALELLRIGGTGNLDDAILRQGGIGSILWNNEPFSQLAWDLKAILDPKLLLPHLFDDPVEQFTYQLLLKTFPPNYLIEHEALYGRIQSQEGEAFRYFQRNGTESTVLDLDGRTHKASSDRLKKTETILAQTTSLSRPTVLFFSEYLRRWGVYQDLDVHQGSPIRRAAITRRETQLTGDGHNLINVLHTLYTTDRNFKSDVNDAMLAGFGREFEALEFTPAEDQRIQMRLRWKSLKNLQSAADLSDGTLRFLMLLAILLNRSRGDLVAIDEPETGLHPSMFPIIAELAAEASQASQIIFSTHSPEFLTAIGHHDPKTTVVQSMAGETKLSALDGDDLKRWLHKYTLGELFVSGGAEALT